MKAVYVRILFLLTGIWFQPAFGWGDLGHETIAVIAEGLLAKEPLVMDHIQKIIGLEPLALASTWADHARADTRFDRMAPYHYMTIFKDDPARRNDRDALVVIEQFPALLLSPKTPREAKMVALRYLLHVTEDLMQPLHVGNEFDRGANYCLVQWQPDEKLPAITTNLHSVWDTNLVEALADQIKAEMSKVGPSPKYFGYKDVASFLMAKHWKTPPALPEYDLSAWVQNAAQLRREKVYPDQLEDDKRPYCNADSKAITLKQMPTLNKEYLEKSLPVIEERMLTGGLRLASLLKTIFKGRPTPAFQADLVFKQLDLNLKTAKRHVWLKTKKARVIE
jgi:hypothetical protein